MYVSTCCLETWLKSAVHNAKEIKFANQNEEQMFKKCQIRYT